MADLATLAGEPFDAPDRGTLTMGGGAYLCAEQGQSVKWESRGIADCHLCDVRNWWQRGPYRNGASPLDLPLRQSRMPPVPTEGFENDHR